MAKWDNQTTENLLKVILVLKDIKEAKMFFRDLLTEAEIFEFSKRWQAAQMLDENITYTEIKKATGLSSRTIARIAKWLNKGMGGYKLMINRLHHSNLTPKGRGLR